VDDWSDTVLLPPHFDDPVTGHQAGWNPSPFRQLVVFGWRVTPYLVQDLLKVSRACIAAAPFKEVGSSFYCANLFSESNRDPLIE
jgi:hypothetical protein